MDSKYYENEFVHTAIKELEYVRTPFYDLAQHEHLKEGEDTSKYLEDLAVKTQMLNMLDPVLRTPTPDKMTIAFNRYGDEVMDDKFKERLQFPMGQPYEIIDKAKHMFKV